MTASALTANAQQWSGTNGPWGGSIRCMAASSTTLYAGTIGHGIFSSVNNGATWAPVAQNVDTTVLSIAASGSIILGGTTGGNVLLSVDGGQHFTLQYINSGYDVGAVAINGTVLFAATQAEGVFVSTNNGSTWTLQNSQTSGMKSQVVTTLAASGGVVYAAIGNAYPGYSSLRKSTNNGVKWDTLNNTAMNPLIHAIAVQGSLLLVGTEGGVYFSMDGGNTWTQRNNGMTDTNVFSLAANATTVFAGTVNYGNPSGIFSYSVSQLLNGQWIAASNGLANTSAKVIYALATSGTNLLAGTDDAVYTSATGGVSLSWTNSNTGLSAMTITALRSNANLLVAGTDDFEVHVSSDQGAHWTHSWNGLFSGNYRIPVRDIALTTSAIFLATDSGFYRSDNAGATWTKKVAGMSDSIGVAIYAAGPAIVAGTNTRGTYVSTNNGDSWSQMSVGLTSMNVSALTANSTNFFAGSGTGGVSTATPGGPLTWIPITTGLEQVATTPVTSMTSSATNVFAATLGGGVFVTNNNLSWTQIAPSTAEIFRSVAMATNGSASTDTLFLATPSQGVYYAWNGASGWKAAAFGLVDTTLASMATQGSLLFVGTADRGVLRSSFPVAGPQQGVANSGPVTGFSFEGIYPNPVATGTDITFSLDASHIVTLSITDASGREVKLLSNEMMSAGTHAFALDASRFAPGVYLCRLSADGLSVTRNIVVAR